MAKVMVRVTYVATFDGGELPAAVIVKALEADDGDFSIFEFADASVESVDLESAK